MKKLKDTKEANMLVHFDQQVRELSLVIEGKLVYYREASAKHFSLAQARLVAGSPRVSVLVPLRQYAQSERGVAYWENLQKQLKRVQVSWQTKMKRARRRSLPATMGLDADGNARDELLRLQENIREAEHGVPLDGNGDITNKSPTIDELWEKLEASLL